MPAATEDEYLARTEVVSAYEAMRLGLAPAECRLRGVTFEQYRAAQQQAAADAPLARIDYCLPAMPPRPVTDRLAVAERAAERGDGVTFERDGDVITLTTSAAGIEMTFTLDTSGVVWPASTDALLNALSPASGAIMAIARRANAAALDAVQVQRIAS